mgnify:CR=1 FL=1
MDLPPNIEEVFPATPLQAGMLFHEPGASVYIQQYAFAVRGRFDMRKLDAAWMLTLQRIPSLRTSFHWEGLSKPLQAVHAKVDYRFHHEDLRALPPDGQEKRLRRSKQGVPISGTEGKTAEERASVLSLSYVSYEGCEDLEPYWLIDSSSMEESVMFWMSEKEFRATLTPRQLDIYLNCIIGGQSKIDYAAANNMQRQSVYNAATLIMKKAKYFFKKF